MDWNQKAQALNYIGSLVLKPSQVVPNGWFASLEHIEVGGNGFLRGLSAHASDPERAVTDLWLEATNLPEGQYLVRHAMSDERKCFRWGRFMWVEVEEHPTELEPVEAPDEVEAVA